LFPSASDEPKKPTEIQTENNKRKPPFGFSLSPAGLLLPYHLGVLHCLLHLGFVDEQTPLAGASAGALAAATAACGVSMKVAMQATHRLSADARERGTARRLHMLLEQELSNLIPEDAHLIINSRPAKLTIAHTQLFPVLRGQFTSEFHTRQDVIDNLLASCNIPFFFSSWPTVTCRGRPCVDGYFAMKTKHFGCPSTDAKRTVRISPFPASVVRLHHSEGDCISPDLTKLDAELGTTEGDIATFVYLASIGGIQATPPSHNVDTCITTPMQKPDQNHLDLEHLAVGGNERFGDGGLPHQSANSVINPPLYEEDVASKISQPQQELGKKQKSAATTGLLLPSLRYSTTELLRRALDASTPADLDEMFCIGIADALRWIKQESRRNTGVRLPREEEEIVYVDKL